MFNSTTAMLSTLKGMPLTLLLAMFLSPTLPLGEAEVAAMVGINRKTARGHLRFLMNLGLVSRTGRVDGWTLTAVSRQLPLPFAPLADGMSIGAMGKSYPSLPSSPSSSFKEETLEIAGGEEEATKLKGKSYPSAKSNGLLRAFQEAGIGMNMWEELAGYEWVTVDYVKAHTWLARQNGDPVGYQIQRMRCGDAAPSVVLDSCPTCGSSSLWNREKQTCYKCSGAIKT